MEENCLSRDEVVQLARLAAAGNAAGTQSFLRRIARRHKQDDPELSRTIVELLRAQPLRSADEGHTVGEPLDADTRFPLVREENPIILTNEPILPSELAGEIKQIVDEHRKTECLTEAGLSPTRTALLVGPPGVGKTLAARWIARELNVPLLVLDLSAVMSSFLGKTGVNLRRVLEYARSRRAVILLDELDAIAKRRDDSTEIGELKRLVTVLLQEVDAWPEGSLLLAATNHGDLLDPAVWRRFDVALDFPLPDEEALAKAVPAFFAEEPLNEKQARLVALLYKGESLSILERDVLRARRVGAVRGLPALEVLLSPRRQRFASLTPARRARAAADLVRGGVSQRRAHEITGASRETIRKHLRTDAKGDAHE